jgi:hypothetical protein
MLGCPPELNKLGTSYLQVHGSICYHFALFKKANYIDADLGCKKYGGVLALVKSAEVNKYLVDTLKHEYRYNEPVWIGLQDIDKEHHYVWEDGTVLNQTLFSNWGESEGPNNDVKHFAEDCIAMDPSDGGKWKDFVCKLKLLNLFGFTHDKSFICQYEIKKSTNITTSTISTSTRSTSPPVSSTASTSTTTTTSTSTTTPFLTTTSTSPPPTAPPVPTCPHLNCNIDCGRDGYQQDTNKCKMCSCNP